MADGEADLNLVQDPEIEDELTPPWLDNVDMEDLPRGGGGEPVPNMDEPMPERSPDAAWHHYCRREVRKQVDEDRDIHALTHDFVDWRPVAFHTAWAPAHPDSPYHSGFVRVPVGYAWRLVYSDRGHPSVEVVR